METLGLRRSGREEKRAPTDFAFDMPAGWRAMPQTQFRRVNLQFGPPDKPGQCYLVALPGGGGSLQDNVNRWRNQLGKEPLGRAEIEELPRRKIEGLGVEATIVDLRGAYTGMDGNPAPGQRFIGLIWQQGGQGHYLVCVGPEALVDQSFAEFESVLGSLRAGAPEARKSPEQALAALLEYDLPEGWQRAEDRPMRIFNFTVGDGGSCYLSQAGGSTLQNINRWRGQLGAAPIAAAEIEKLPVVPILGADAVVIEVAGDFAGGMGSEKIDDAMLIGAIAEVRGTALFVKMLGPKRVIAEQRDRFLAFCRSLRTKGTKPTSEGK